MQVDLLVLLTNLFGLFLLLGVGFGAVKLRAVPLSANAGFSAFLIKIALPCTVFASMQQPFSMEFLKDSGVIVLLNFGLFGLNLLLAGLFARLLRVSSPSRGTFCLLVAFCNNGFMGFPIIQALFGSEGLALAAMVNIPVCLIMYSATPFLLSGSETKTKLSAKMLRQSFITPVNISVVVGLLAFLIQLPIPDAIMNPIKLLGNVTTPLSMFLTGMTLSQIPLRSVWNDSTAWKATFLRLLVFPAMTLLLLRLLPIESQMVINVTLVTLSMPAAAIISTLAETYNADRALAAKTIFLTSLLCILTIPLFALAL